MTRLSSSRWTFVDLLLIHPPGDQIYRWEKTGNCLFSLMLLDATWFWLHRSLCQLFCNVFLLHSDVYGPFHLLTFFHGCFLSYLGDNLWVRLIDLRSGFVFWLVALVSATTPWGWGWICRSDPTGWQKPLDSPTAAAAESPSWTLPVGPRRTESLHTGRSERQIQSAEGNLLHRLQVTKCFVFLFAYLARSSPRWPCSRESCEPRLVRPLGGAAWCRSPGRWSPRAPPLRAWRRDAPWGLAGEAGGGRRPSEERKLQEKKRFCVKNNFEHSVKDIGT